MPDLRIKFNNPNYYKEIQALRKNPGFASMAKNNPELHLKLSSKGGINSGKNRNEKNSTKSEQISQAQPEAEKETKA